MLFPLYKKIDQKLENKTLSALAIVCIMLIFIIAPFGIIIHKASVEATAAYTIVKGNLFEGSNGCDGSIVCSLYGGIDKLASTPQLSKLFENSFNIISDYLVRTGSGVIFSIPSIVLSIFIAIFVTYYGLKEYKVIVQYLNKLIDVFSPVSKEYLQQRFKEVVNGVIYGQLIIALIQGVIAAIGYFMFGMKSVVFFGLLTAIAALIPFLGTGLIWVPASLWQILNGLIASDNTVLWKGVGLFIYGVVIISSTDNIIRPKLIGERAKVHPVIVLLGVLGGLKLFGFIGFVIGPVVLSVCLLFVNIFVREMDGA